MPPAHLPPLAALRFGAAPTGMEAPASRRRHVGPATTATEPQLPALAGLPRDVIEVMVTQAALSARASAAPVLTICKWMKNFCKAAKVQGVVGCEDRWYKLALQVFGVAPDAPKPAQMGYDWRVLFGVVCDAFHGPNSAPGLTTESGFPMTPFRWNASQGEMDRELAALLEREAAWHVADRSRNSTFQQEIELLKASWNAMGQPDDPRRTKTPPLSKAMAVLLVLKGAVPWRGKEYRDLDDETGKALERFYHDKEISADEALRLVRSALDRGAHPSRTHWRYTSKGAPLMFADTLMMAVPVEQSVNQDIVNLLLDRGATMPASRPASCQSFFDVLAMETLEPYWAVDQSTTERLIDVLKEHVRSLHFRGDGARFFGMKNHMYLERISEPHVPAWLAAAWRRLFSVEEWMDPSELARIRWLD